MPFHSIEATIVRPHLGSEPSVTNATHVDGAIHIHQQPKQRHVRFRLASVKSWEETSMRSGNKAKRHDGRFADPGDAPTQLRQQRYGGHTRPGAYWSAPGVASVLGPAEPADLQAGATRHSAQPGRPSQARHTEVLLEAEPVLSILVNATPAPVEMPVLASKPPPQPQRLQLQRRTAIMVLAIIAIVAGAVAAGVIVGTTSASQNSAARGEALNEGPAPYPAPTAAPMWAPASGGGEESAPSTYIPSLRPSRQPIAIGLETDDDYDFEVFLNASTACGAQSGCKGCGFGMFENSTTLFCDMACSTRCDCCTGTSDITMNRRFAS